MFHRTLAALFAAALSLSVASMAAAATVNESVTVLSSYACSGIPASVAYPSATPGNPTTATAFTLACSGNVSYKLYAKLGTDLSDGSGHTIAKTARQINLSNVTGTGTNNLTGFTSFDSSGQVLSGGGIFNADPGSAGVDVTMRLNIGATQAPGSYTGSFDLSVGL